MQLFVVLALAIALLAVIFALQNTTIISITFFAWQLRGSLAFFLLAVLVIGVLVGLLLSVPPLVRRSWFIARQKRQIEDLDWALQSKHQELNAQQDTHQHQTTQLHQNTRELLLALAVLDPVTGLLKGTYVVAGLTYLLQQLASLSKADQPNSVCVFRIELSDAFEVKDGQPLHLTAVDHQRLHQAIAQRLTQLSSTAYWLYADGQGMFTCLAVGLESREASQYGESLRANLADYSISLPEERSVTLSISIGGAIAQASDGVDATTFLATVDEALEQAKRRGRNRFRFVQAKHP
jgi:GGDEF domain-containing protein/uncharacterized integral membrane protein